MDTPAAHPYRISIMLGGIMTPRPPPTMTHPVARVLLYPRESIDGRASSPIRITPAPTIPVQAPKMMAIPMVASARPALHGTK